MRRILDLVVDLVTGVLAPPGAHPTVSTDGAGPRRRRTHAARRRGASAPHEVMLSGVGGAMRRHGPAGHHLVRAAAATNADVKVVRLLGEFVWHAHPDTDELFMVRSGTLVIQLRDGDVTLGPGDVYVIPASVEHCPIAREEVEALLIERVGTINTGDAGGDRTFEAREL